MDIAGSMNITFKADIAALRRPPPSVLYWVLQPGSNVGGIGAGLVRMVRPWNEWLDRVGLRHQRRAARRRRGCRDPDRPKPAGRARSGRRDHRSLAVGQQRDVRHAPAARAGVLRRRRRSTATRRATGWAPTPRSRTPTTWPGRSPRCCNGQAAPALLDTYSAERAPVAEQIVKRANKSSREFVRALRGARASLEAEHRGGDGGRDRGAEGQHPARRRQARRPGVGDGAEELRVQRPRRGTRPVLRVRPRSSPTAACRPEPTRDPDLYYEASTVPGSHLPHAWVGDNTRASSPSWTWRPYRQFTLITGIAGEAWATAAREGRPTSSASPLATVVIGPGREVTDLYYDWAKLREVDESGALLVRPDKHIGWRAMSLPADPEGALRDRADRPSWAGDADHAIRPRNPAASACASAPRAAAANCEDEVDRLGATASDGDRLARPSAITAEPILAGCPSRAGTTRW